MQRIRSASGSGYGQALSKTSGRRLAETKVAFRCLNQNGVETDNSTGQLILTILGYVAQFECDILRNRQQEGIEKAKAAGRYKG